MCPECSFLPRCPHSPHPAQNTTVIISVFTYTLEIEVQFVLSRTLEIPKQWGGASAVCPVKPLFYRLHYAFPSEFTLKYNHRPQVVLISGC